MGFISNGFVALVACACVSATLISYDCQDPATNITVISMNNVATCEKDKDSYKVKTVDIKVIQRNEVAVQQVQTCLVDVTRSIFYCGMHSHISIVRGGVSSLVYPSGEEECSNLHRYRSVKIYQQTIGQITMNGTTSASLTIIGSLGMDGKCDGAVYHERCQTWNGVVVVADVKITAQDYPAKVKMDVDEISLKGGITCPYISGYCFDTMYGESVWRESRESSCEAKLTLIYEDQAEIVTDRFQQQYLVVQQAEKTFTLTLVKPISLCNRVVWQTEHPRLMAAEGENGKYLSPRMRLIPENTDLMAYVKSKFLYIEQAYKREIDKVYSDSVYRRCLMHREILMNKLLLTQVASGAVSLLYNNRPGYVGRVLGEVVYIMKCLPKVVKIRRIDRCFHELPIEFDNQSVFMAPLTRIIQRHAEEIDCNPLTPPVYNVEGQWIGLSPQPVAVNRPEELRVEAEGPLPLDPIRPISSSGLYTQEELDQVRSTLTFGAERKAVQNIVAKRVAGMPAGGQGYSTVGLFDAAELKELAVSTTRQIWGWFTDFGLFISGLLGFYVIFRLVKYTVGAILNGLQLYQVFGCGFGLLACVWNTLTMWVLNRRRASGSPRDNKDKVELDLKVIPNEVRNETEPRANAPNLYLSVVHWTDSQGQ